MKIFFLDQSGGLGGAELCLLDVAQPYQSTCQVGLFADGDFRKRLEQQQIPVQVLTTRSIAVRKESGWIKGLSSLNQLMPLILKTAKIAQDYDLIYANTQKALVVGALASLLSGRPLVYHLHDILSAEHFSNVNRRLAIALANQFATAVIANSEATRTAFLQAGGRSNLVHVVYNGFEPKAYQLNSSAATTLKQQLGIEGFLVGHFSRLSPWKGQHILIEALQNCPPDVSVILVGAALFGEQNYVQTLHEQVANLGLQQRVHFLGFRQDVIPLMQACDLVVHTSTAPEPFGRVIVEAMLCQRPVIAAGAGGAIELIQSGETGWLVPPNDPQQLAEAITDCYDHPDIAASIAQQAQQQAIDQFDSGSINQQIAQILETCMAGDRSDS